MSKTSHVRRCFLSLTLGAILVGGVGLTSGCGQYKSAAEKLRVTATSFNENVRWNRIVAASKSIPTTKRVGWVRYMRAVFRTMRIVDYAMVPVRIGSTRATVDIHLAYYQVPDPTVIRERRRQIWSLRGSNWLLESDKKVRHAKAKVIQKLKDFDTKRKGSTGPLF